MTKTQSPKVNNKAASERYGCMKSRCYHGTITEALSHIAQQRSEWWNGLRPDGKVKLAKLQNLMAVRSAFKSLTTGESEWVQ